MVTTAKFAETRDVLQNISWHTFKAMLADMGCESKKVGQIAATRAFRTWVRQQISTAGQ
ncbi:hypothetical protein [Nostoc sp.]|uniref:hypothetical protein n=1 Tax=Nostoc sp. TaxID=1180 RepID=UPI003FA5683D